jgi:hypothetical protein
MFDSIRVKNLEDDAPYKVWCEIDKKGAFNYGSEKIMKSNLSMEEYRKIFIKELNLITTDKE